MIEIRKLKQEVGYASNSYLVISGGEGVVIDPSCPYDGEAVADTPIKYILLTHGHFDHFLEIDSWVENTGAKVIISEKDKDALADSHKNCYSLFLFKDFGYYGDYEAVSEGDELSFGEESISVMEFPGHTPGSVSYMIGKYAFAGDLAFAGGGYGRFDLPGGNPQDLVASLKRLCELDEDIIIYPGHGEETTISEYKNYLGM